MQTFHIIRGIVLREMPSGKWKSARPPVTVWKEPGASLWTATYAPAWKTEKSWVTIYIYGESLEDAVNKLCDVVPIETEKGE